MKNADSLKPLFPVLCMVLLSPGCHGAKPPESLKAPLAVLGLSSDSRMLRPEERRLLAKALGRVAVHELVHRMSPERSHASEGLMRERLGRSLLARERLPLDEESTRAFFSALQTEPRHLSPGRRPK